MKRLQNIPAAAGVLIADAVTALALPPPSFGLVPATWSTPSGGDVPELELELWAIAAVNMTGAQLYAAVLHPLPIAPTALTSASGATNKFTLAAHGKLTGDGPAFVTSAGTEPGGVDPATPYWLVVDSANTFLLALSLEDALAGTTVDLSSNGTGQLTLTGPDAQRLHWHSRGLLGPAGDGAIALGAQASYWTVQPHSSRVVAYALVATLSDTIAVSAAILPRFDRD